MTKDILQNNCGRTAAVQTLKERGRKLCSHDFVVFQEQLKGSHEMSQESTLSNSSEEVAYFFKDDSQSSDDSIEICEVALEEESVLQSKQEHTSQLQVARKKINKPHLETTDSNGMMTCPSSPPNLAVFTCLSPRSLKTPPLPWLSPRPEDGKQAQPQSDSSHVETNHQHPGGNHDSMARLESGQISEDEDDETTENSISDNLPQYNDFEDELGPVAVGPDLDYDDEDDNDLVFGEETVIHVKSEPTDDDHCGYESEYQAYKIPTKTKPFDDDKLLSKVFGTSDLITSSDDNDCNEPSSSSSYSSEFEKRPYSPTDSLSSIPDEELPQYPSRRPEGSKTKTREGRQSRKRKSGSKPIGPPRKILPKEPLKRTFIEEVPDFPETGIMSEIFRKTKQAVVSTAINAVSLVASVVGYSGSSDTLSSEAVPLTSASTSNQTHASRKKTESDERKRKKSEASKATKNKKKAQEQEEDKELAFLVSKARTLLREMPQEQRSRFWYKPITVPQELENRTHKRTPQRPRAETRNEQLERRSVQNRGNVKRKYERDKFVAENRRRHIEHWKVMLPQMEALVPKVVRMYAAPVEEQPVCIFINGVAVLATPVQSNSCNEAV